MRALVLLLPLIPLLSADPINCDLHNARSSLTLDARIEGETLKVTWTGEQGTRLRAFFGIDHAAPVVRELSAGGVVLGHNLTPEFSTVSGVRRAAHGLDYEHRWDV